MSYPDGTVPTDQTVHPTPIYETLAMGLGAWVLWQLRDRVRAGILFAHLPRSTRGPSASSSSSCAATTTAALGLTTAQLESLAMMAAGAVWIAIVSPPPRRHRAPGGERSGWRGGLGTGASPGSTGILRKIFGAVYLGRIGG